MKRLLPGLLWILCLSLVSAADFSWRTKLEQQLPLMGEGNWIVVADASYPWQVSSGIETVETGASQEEVLQAVMAVMKPLPHLRPVLYVETEGFAVTEEGAKGLAAHRAMLKTLLNQLQLTSTQQAGLLQKISEAGKTVHVLVLKTRLSLPHNSLFLQLQANTEAGKTNTPAAADKVGLQK